VLVNVPQYAVTVLLVEFRLENRPAVLFGPVQVPDSTSPLIVPRKVNPLPERFSVFVDESKVPVRAVVLLPVTCRLPVAATVVAWAWSVATNGNRKNEAADAATRACTVTVSVPRCPPLPAKVP
jgi:hypothetical protein